MYDAEVAGIYESHYVEGQGKDYAAEAEGLTALVRSRAPRAASLLDVACGTGAHLAHLRRDFLRVAGVELSAPMREMAVARMAAHLAPGGVLVIEPWFTPEQWRDGHVSHTVAHADIRTIVRMGHSTQAGRVSRMHNHYLIGEPGRGVRHFRDEHTMTLFTTHEYEQAVAAAGLAGAEWRSGWSEGRNLLVATRSE